MMNAECLVNIKTLFAKKTSECLMFVRKKQSEKLKVTLNVSLKWLGVKEIVNKLRLHCTFLDGDTK